jgi:phosphopantothenoylcysteine decarboxylase
VAVPSSNRAHTSHPAFMENIARLRSWGVTVIWETDGYPVLDPVTGSNTSPIPWEAALDALSVKTGSG